ncbi:MAG: D-alanyl-D-alanine carboxypeptidase/D-alanyl-D-alanine-endopeptidase [Bacteroidetes bacterium GWA2_31_9]|nr:MAG: D-alanyl-D-alanine carboxypeptidase/D-alanyl-D-alanine-endopeptidase [Bacteroidetes bacterium GWA2_31_9]
MILFKTIVVVSSLILAFNSINAQVKSSQLVENNIEKIFNKFSSKKEFKNASIGFIVKSVSDSSNLFEYNPDISLTPASIQKIITTSTALELYGKKYKIPTYLQYDGYIDSNKTLHGNIYIKGNGDPTLGSEYFNKDKGQSYFIEQWVNKIKNNGIDSIAGNIIGDDLSFPKYESPNTWIWGDIGNYFGAPASGLSIYDNTFKIFFSPGDSISALAKINKITPEIPNFNIQNEVKISKIDKDLAYITGSPNEFNRFISGSIPKKNEDFIVKGSLPEPSYIISNELSNSLKSQNIRIAGYPISIRKLLNDTSILNSKRVNIDTLYSPSFKNIVGLTNLISNNLYAEHLLLQCAAKRSTIIDIDTSCKIIKEFWGEKGIDTSGMYMSDGSGLSKFNAVTPRQFAEILYYMRTKSKNTDAFFESLPIAGKTGTLKSLCKGTVAEGHVFAKSGTITRVRNYAGYYKNLSNKEFIFVIMLNNYNCSNDQAKKYIEELLIDLVKVN